MTKGIILDIGTGNGKFTYSLAKQNPDKLIIGIDPNQSNLVKTSAKIYKKPSRGGLENVLFVLADINNLPEELTNAVNQIFILFPWGSLFKALINVEQNAWNNIKRVAQKGAVIDIIFGHDKTQGRTEMKKLDLPELSEQFINTVMLPEIKSLGFQPKKFETIDSENIKNLPSSWAKKLSLRKSRIYYYLSFISSK